MLVVDVDALQTIHFLDFVHQVFLQVLLAHDCHDVVRVARAIHQRISVTDALAFLHVDMDAARQRVFLLLAIVADDIDLAHALADLAVLHDAVDLGDHGGFARLAGFEQFHHTRQTAGDVLGLGGCARNFRQHVSGVNVIPIGHRQVGVHGHQVALFVVLAAPGGTNVDGGNALLIGGIHHHPLRAAGDFVNLLLHGDAIGQVFEMHHAADLGEDRERVRIPLQQNVVGLHFDAVPEVDLRAVDHLVAFFFAALLVEDGDDAVAVHGNQFALGVLDRGNADEFDEAVGLRILLGLFGRAGGRAADVERAHGELGARFADRLGGDNAHRFAALDQPAGGQVAAIAELANAALRFAGQHGANLHALNTGRLNRRRQILGNFRIHRDNAVAFVIELVFERHAADDAIAQRFDDFARFDDGFDIQTVAGAAIGFRHDDVLRHVAQAAREVTGIRRLESGIRQTLAGAVRGDEVLQHVQAFAEVGRDGLFDNFARRLGHQTAHTGKLADLLFRAARAGIGHDVNRIEVAASAVVFLHRLEHFLGDAFGHLRPDLDDLVVAFAVRDGAFLILRDHFDDRFFGGLDQRSLLARHDHVVDANRNSGAGGVQEAQGFDVIEHRHRDRQAELEVTIMHHLGEALLLQQTVDEGHFVRQNII